MIEAGMYVRTNEGHIDKVLEVEDSPYFKRIIRVTIGEEDYYGGHLEFTDWFSPDHYIKASYDITDLIGVGDVISFKENIDRFSQVYILGIYDSTLLREIKEKINKDELRLVQVLTKEQFEKNSYKVGD